MGEHEIEIVSDSINSTVFLEYYRGCAFCLHDSLKSQVVALGFNPAVSFPDGQTLSDVPLRALLSFWHPPAPFSRY